MSFRTIGLAKSCRLVQNSTDNRVWHEGPTYNTRFKPGLEEKESYSCCDSSGFLEYMEDTK
ncbi:hypothetical protein Hanom_Chr06g00550021 [Helianthus anomalus]